VSSTPELGLKKKINKISLNYSQLLRPLKPSTNPVQASASTRAKSTLNGSGSRDKILEGYRFSLSGRKDLLFLLYYKIKTR
jgi:hypothetical protein